MIDEERKNHRIAYCLFLLVCGDERAYELIGSTKPHQHSDLCNAVNDLQGDALRDEVRAWLVSQRLDD